MLMFIIKMKGSETTVECPMVLISEIQGGMGGMGYGGTIPGTSRTPYRLQFSILHGNAKN